MTEAPWETIHRAAVRLEAGIRTGLGSPPGTASGRGLECGAGHPQRGGFRWLKLRRRESAVTTKPHGILHRIDRHSTRIQIISAVIMWIGLLWYFAAPGTPSLIVTGAGTVAFLTPTVVSITIAIRILRRRRSR